MKEYKEIYKYIMITALTYLAVIVLVYCARYYQAQSGALLITAAILFGMGLYPIIRLINMLIFGGKHHGNKK